MSKSIPGSAHLNLTLGGLVVLGGVIGYVKKGSKASLMAGVGAGSLLLGTGYMIAYTDKIFEAHVLGTTSSGMLALAMGQRFLSSGKFMPSGLVAVIGAAGCAYNLKKAMEWAPTKNE